MTIRQRRLAPTAALLACALPALLAAQPTILPGFDGFLGQTPGTEDLVSPPEIAISTRATPSGEGNAVSGRVVTDLPPPTNFDPPEFELNEQLLHATGVSVDLGGPVVSFVEVEETAPALEPFLTDPDRIAAAFTYDGPSTGTMTVELRTLALDGGTVPAPVVLSVPTIGVPDPGLYTVDLAQDDQNRAIAVYTDLTGGTPKIGAQGVDWDTGTPFDVPDFSGGVDPEIAILDPGGETVVVYRNVTTPTAIKGRFVDNSGAMPVVLPEFAINTTVPAVGAINPAVAADPTTGQFLVAWEDLSGAMDDPVNVRARRFDAMGNPVGDDFMVNTTTADAQGQPQAAFGPGGRSAIVWAGDDSGTESVDVYVQAYDRDGGKIGGEVRANDGLASEDDHQDHPTVRFLPEPDAMGRPQFVVAWRDAADTTGSGAGPNGTGAGYRCFSFDDPAKIFSDGFESGDTSSWSGSVP